MRAILIGADFEENLGVGILAACLEREGHAVEILPFNVAADTAPLVARVCASAPDLVGLSMQFQHRAPEFLALSRALRRAGYRGHVTCGGQFPTLAFREVLEGEHGIDTVVLHDGEHTLVALAEALVHGRSLRDTDDGLAVRTAERRMPDDLDAIPFPKRYRDHNRHMGVPFVPLLGGRGCWGKCNYCSIVAFYRDGREHGGGRLFRLRSPENVARRWPCSGTAPEAPASSASTTTTSRCPRLSRHSSACGRSGVTSTNTASARSASSARRAPTRSRPSSRRSSLRSA
jgi:anaerobic magnesium-protoporphyrin IX monomethyl ester cyclase